MHDLFRRIALAADTDEEAARRSVGYIAAFMRAESHDQSVVGEMIRGTPGVVEAIDAVGGAGGGGIFALGARLMGLGLDRMQIRAVAEELADYARGTAGEETVGRAIHSVPAFAPFV